MTLLNTAIEKEDHELNQKRIYLVMARHQLLPKAPKRRHSSRVHDGQVSVPMSNMRWCSDGFEIKCDSGETVTATFAKDCCDREILAWRAWEGKGLPGEPVRDMLVEAVERRFAAVEAMPEACELEFLTDKVIPFFAFPPEVRRVIYTTNAIESVHARLRKIIKTRGHFPSDDAATKLIWLALRNITEDWGRAANNWKSAMN